MNLTSQMVVHDVLLGDSLDSLRGLRDISLRPHLNGSMVHLAASCQTLARVVNKSESV